MQRIKRHILLGTLLLLGLLFAVGLIDTINAREPSERFKGYNLQRGKWVVGNLGKVYVEGDLVSYQLRIDEASKLWGKNEFSISFNFFQPSSDATYIDGFDTSEATGFQWSIGDFLPDGTEIPPVGWGTHIPTPEAGESASPGAPQITNYMNAWPPGTSDGSPAGSDPAKERYFTFANVPWPQDADHIILFYRAHLTMSTIWKSGSEASLPTALDGDEFQDWTAAWGGASFATGSSRHFTLQDPEVGDKTIPIPIVLYPSNMINGYKFFCNNQDPVNDWPMTLTGTLKGGKTYGPVTVYTGAAPWSQGYFEFAGLEEGSYTLQEATDPIIVNYDIVCSGDATNVVIEVGAGRVSFDLTKDGTETVNFYNTWAPY